MRNAIAHEYFTVDLEVVWKTVCETRVWIAKRYEDRSDNLRCVTAALEMALVMKTVMHHFSWGSGS